MWNAQRFKAQPTKETEAQDFQWFSAYVCLTRSVLRYVFDITRYWLPKQLLYVQYKNVQRSKVAFTWTAAELDSNRSKTTKLWQKQICFSFVFVFLIINLFSIKKNTNRYLGRVNQTLKAIVKTAPLLLLLRAHTVKVDLLVVRNVILLYFLLPKSNKYL